jgi:POT family proton-dependent oligopeptide transporter
LGSVILILIAAFFVYLFVAGGLTADEKKRLGVIAWIFILAAIFWSGFEQAGSSLNLFARDLTDRVMFGWEMPAGWLQSVNSLFIIICAPLFGMLWLWLAGINKNPSTGVKFALGLLGLGAGFFVLAWGAAQATVENPVTPAWLVVTFFFHTVGELCLSPVGMSTITKLAPKGRVSQMMGIWFVATALGNLFAGLVAGRMESLAPAALFSNVAMIVAVAGLISILVSPVVKKMMMGAK